MSSWVAAATSYSTNNRIMVPFYIFYSMFGFQRIGDLAWAAGDMQARGFLLGATSGRTTLNGEGLQHQDGHSHLMSATIPNCVSYDPTYAHELAVIMQHGLKRMVQDQENVWYYITVMNENYPHPGLKKGQEEGILRGMYRLREGPAGSGMGASIQRVQLLGSGTILREAIAAAELLWNDWGVAGDVWSVTSFTELRRDGIDVERWNLLHPTDKPRKAYVTQQLEKTVGPIVATTDYMRLFADQIRAYLPRGRSYTRARHRRLRPLRHPREAARVLRGRPALRRHRGAACAGRRRPRAAIARWPRRSRSTASIPNKRNPATV